MSRFVAFLVLAGTLLLTSTSFAADGAKTPSEMAALLNPSVFAFGVTGRSHSFCTATKIAPRQYLTAKHCAVSADVDFRLESSTGEYAFIRSVVVAASEKRGEGKVEEDWAILNATSDNAAPALPLGCGDTHRVGEPVSYMGFPEGLERAFGMGYISTMKGYVNNSDIFVDLPAAPGASGSAVVSAETGHIIGVLTEGVYNTRTREFYMIGLENIEHVDQCEDWAQRMKFWEKQDEKLLRDINRPDLEELPASEVYPT